MHVHMSICIHIRTYTYVYAYLLYTHHTESTALPAKSDPVLPRGTSAFQRGRSTSQPILKVENPIEFERVPTFHTSVPPVPHKYVQPDRENCCFFAHGFGDQVCGDSHIQGNQQAPFVPVVPPKQLQSYSNRHVGSPAQNSQKAQPHRPARKAPVKLAYLMT